MNYSLIKNDYLKTFIPISITMIAMFLYNITDTYFISKLGEEAFAGFGLMNPIVLFTIILFNATSSSVSINLGKAFGANRIARIKKKIFVGASMLFFLSLFFFTLLNVFSTQIANIYDVSESVKVYFLEYFNIWTWTLLFNSLIVLFSYSLNSMKRTKLSTTIHMVGLFINLVLDYIFIFGLFDIIPAFGLAGAAYATLISNIIHLGILIYFFNKMRLLTFNISLAHYKIFFSKIGKLALPLSMHGVIVPLGLFFFAVFVSRYSVAEIAAWTLYMKLEALFFMVAVSANATFGILASIYLGNKKYSLIPVLFTLSNRIFVVWLFILISVAFLFSSNIGEFFLENEDSLSFFSTTLVLGFIAYLLDAAHGNIIKMFTVLHNPYIGLILASFRISIAIVILPFIFSYWFGYFGLFYGFILGTILSFFFGLKLFKKYSKDIDNIKFNSLYW